MSRPRRRPASRVAAQILDQVPPARAADASREYAICGDDERLLPSSQRKVQAVVDRAAAVGLLHGLGLYCTSSGGGWRRFNSLPIIPFIVNDSLAQIAPAETAISRPTATARRWVDASVSARSMT